MSSILIVTARSSVDPGDLECLLRECGDLPSAILLPRVVVSYLLPFDLARLINFLGYIELLFCSDYSKAQSDGSGLVFDTVPKGDCSKLVRLAVLFARWTPR